MWTLVFLFHHAKLFFGTSSALEETVCLSACVENIIPSDYASFFEGFFVHK